MDKLLGFLNLGAVVVKRVRYDDDLVDRLNHRYTPFLFFIFCFLVMSRQYIWGTAMSCWTPAHFTSSYIQYTNMACWVTNTYYIPMETYDIPDAVNGGREYQQIINYYQWVPLILIFQALFYYAPYAIWDTYNRQSGIDVPSFVDAGFMLKSTKLEDRKKVLTNITNYFHEYLMSTKVYGSETWYKTFKKHSVSRRLMVLIGIQYGNYITALYLTCKLLYVINAISQMWIINIFLANDYTLYGTQILANYYHGLEEWTGSDRFPRVAMCDFQVRAIARVQTHTVQVTNMCIHIIILFSSFPFLCLFVCLYVRLYVRHMLPC